jgi:hypothetical protein
MIDSNDLVKNGSDDEIEAFETKVKNQEPDVLVAAASYINANVPEGASWQDYAEAFEEYSWKDATRALEHGAGGADYNNL